MKPVFLTLWLIGLAISWTNSHADQWGHLFTTPAQRAQLDSSRSAPVTTDDGSNDAPQAAALQPIQLTGTLTSSRGKRTVWLNGKPVTQGVRVLDAGRVQLRITSTDDARLMKSGQLLYPQSGEIVEGYAAAQSAPAETNVQTDTTAHSETDSANAPM